MLLSPLFLLSYIDSSTTNVRPDTQRLVDYDSSVLYFAPFSFAPTDLADCLNRYCHCQAVNTTNKGSVVPAVMKANVGANTHVTALKMEWTDCKATLCGLCSSVEIHKEICLS